MKCLPIPDMVFWFAVWFFIQYNLSLTDGFYRQVKQISGAHNKSERHTPSQLKKRRPSVRSMANGLVSFPYMYNALHVLWSACVSVTAYMYYGLHMLRSACVAVYIYGLHMLRSTYVTSTYVTVCMCCSLHVLRSTYVTVCILVVVREVPPFTVKRLWVSRKALYKFNQLLIIFIIFYGLHVLRSM